MFPSFRALALSRLWIAAILPVCRLAERPLHGRGAAGPVFSQSAFQPRKMATEAKMSEFVTVDIAQGRLQGKRVTSPTTGVTYYSFQGIPYAKPPVGPLRFKPPEEPEPWTGTWNATVEGAVPPQIDIFTGKFVGNDDCLFLNVYTSQCSAKSAKAVMVWLYGGGLTFGSGNTDVYGPDFLVAEDVVLVTINYRLGQLGFLYMEGTDVTGNNGLRDQVMALKWVKNNIAHFGGDPGKVTIFGESAGGFSVHHLLMTPQAAGLFHRGISQSATALLPGCIVPCEVSARRALSLAKQLGCTSDDPQQVVNFLRTVPAEEIVAAQTAVAEQEENTAMKIPPFLPCEESGPEALIPSSPLKLLEEGRFIKVPFMIGVTSADGGVLLGQPRNETLAEVEKDFKTVVPYDLAGGAETPAIAEKIRQFYFGDKPINEEVAINYMNMQTDLYFAYPMYRSVQLQLRSTPHPIYAYLFDHTSDTVVNVFPILGGDLPGAAHTAELPYLFQSAMKPNKFPPGSPDTEVQSNMVKLWTQFAKTGNPSTEVDKIKWTPTTKETFDYLKISGGISMEKNLYKRRMDFLRDLYNNFSRPIVHKTVK